MGRKKLEMELIRKEKTRKTTYKTRKQGIIKKLKEFTILCDVDAVMILYPPNSTEPEIWPENPEKINKTIACHKTRKVEDDKKRSYDLNDFFEDRTKKMKEDLVKARRKNMNSETWFDELNELSEVQLREFAMGLETKENLVRAYLEAKKRNMNVKFPFMFDLEENRQPMVVHYPVNHHDRGWYGDAAVGSFMKCQTNVFSGYPVFDSGVAYGEQSQWGFQATVGYGGGKTEIVRQEHGLEVDNGGDFVMFDPRGRFFSCV